MEQDEIISRLEKDFESLKKDMKIKSSFDDLERIFFLKDYIQKEGYVSTRLSRAISRRIVDLYMSWAGYLHGLIIPNPNSMITVTEHNMFEDKEKEEILRLMNRILAHCSKNSLNGLTQDLKEEAKFIDDSVALWDGEVNPKMVELIRKVNKGWTEKANEKPSA